MNRIFNENNIILNAEPKTKEEAIDLAGTMLILNGYVEQEYLQAMHEREKVISTYIGNNVGIPHGIDGSSVFIKESGISLIQVPEGVDYNGETAYVVMGIAGKDGTHLDILTKLAEIICEIENVEKLRYAKTKQEILDIIGDVM